MVEKVSIDIDLGHKKFLILISMGGPSWEATNRLGLARIPLILNHGSILESFEGNIIFIGYFRIHFVFNTIKKY
jgi:hypothetical protein